MGSALDFLNGGNPFAGSPDVVGDPDGSGLTVASGGGDYGMGLLQSLTALGTGYLSRRLDVDLQQRITGAQPLPGLRTTQNGIGGYGGVVSTPQGQRVATVNLSAVTPLLVVAVIAFFLARRGN